jgi:hypothetical protein
VAKHLTLPSSAVVVIVSRAEPTGAEIDLYVDKEWWAGADKEHRRTLFVGTLEALGAMGLRVIPEEFKDDASSTRPLEPMDIPDDAR